MKGRSMLSNPVPFSDNLKIHWNHPGSITRTTQHHPSASEVLSASITKAASRQTYYTIRWLVDQGRTANAYRAYAYFRWLDDKLDEGLLETDAGMALVGRQQALIESAYAGEQPREPMVEESMLLDLIQSDQGSHSGLQVYIQHMMAVTAFDARRRGRLISQYELDDYTRHLAVAVTEVLHYFIGHDAFAPYDETRYLAVAGAHIAHMLRDTHEDIAAGYYNIPREFLEAHGIGPLDIESPAYRDWVKSRVQLARDYFRAGKAYLAQVENHRARLAGYAYVARFEDVLDTIERDGYQLRPGLDDRKSLRTGLRLGWSVFKLMLRENRRGLVCRPSLESRSLQALDGTDDFAREQSCYRLSAS